MLRKTAAIAVLILVVSSLTFGSVGRVQTVAVAESGKDAAGEFPAGGEVRVLPPAAGHSGVTKVQHMAGVTSAGFTRTMSDIDAAYTPGISFVTMADGQVMSGVVHEGMALPSLPDENVSSIVVYTDELRLEQPAPGAFEFAVLDNGTFERKMFVVPVRMPDKPDADNMTIVGKMAYVKPGEDPEFYDFQWKKNHTAGMPDNGTFARFSGQATLPGHNISFDKGLPPGVLYDPVTGAIEVRSDMVVDMEKLRAIATAQQSIGTATGEPATGSATADQASDTYNNHITAGETSWHVASVADSVRSVNVDVKWTKPDSKLRLVIYTPDGRVLGPYYDDSDGKTDGRINLNIASPSGVAAGEWHLKVTDMDPLGSDDYYVKTY